MNYPTDSHPTRDCLETRNAPGFCLRFEASRERIALPYSSLVSSTLANDETVLELFFVTHRIIINGRKLHAAHCAIAAGLAVAICQGRKSTRATALKTARYQYGPDEIETMVISDVRVESLPDAG